MRKRNHPYHADIVFQPALTPLEAAMLPARETRGYGALRLARRAFELWPEPCGCRQPHTRDQRQKIWVR